MSPAIIRSNTSKVVLFTSSTLTGKAMEFLLNLGFKFARLFIRFIREHFRVIEIAMLGCSWYFNLMHCKMFITNTVVKIRNKVRTKEFLVVFMGAAILDYIDL